MAYAKIVLLLFVAILAQTIDARTKDPRCPWPDPLDHTVHLPHENDCTKFYKCDHGDTVLFDCPDGLHFNAQEEVCDWPANAGCVAAPPVTVPPLPTTTTKAPTTAEPAPPTRPEEWDDDCPFPDPLNYTVHLPHEKDCTKFYKCDHGQKVEFDCPDGLHFNQGLQVCDWPQNAGCVVVPPITVTDPPPTTTTTKAPTTTAPAPTRPPNWDDDCPFPDPLNHTVHLPHEDDCSKFYKCDHGQKVEFDCPDGLHFNQGLQVCDWPQNAGCVVVPPITVTDPPPTTTTTKAPTTTAPAPTRPPNWDDDCPFPDPLNHTVHLPHEDDCSKFYKCDHGQKVEFDCPDGLHFNQGLQVCDWPQNAGCVVVPPITVTDPPPTTTTTKAPTTTAPAPTRPPNWDDDCPFPDPLNHTVHLPHEDDCSKFYKCDHGQKVEFDCPDGLHFNSVLEVCDWPQNAGCVVVPPITVTDPPPTTTTPAPTKPPTWDDDCPFPDPLNHTVHLPHEDDCSKFYKCDHGQKVEFDCPDGLHFNQGLQVCDWPQNAGCVVVPPITVTDPPPTTTTTKAPTTTAPAPTRPPNWDDDCPFPDPLNHTVHLPHEDDCSKFYKCDHGQKVEFDCPDGLHFNQGLQVCDWPQNAGCVVVPPITVTDPPPTTTTTKAPTTTAPAPTRPPNWDDDCPFPDPLNYTVHLPHEDDCSKFYKCDNGQKVEFDCPDGLHFNQGLQVCDWPQNAGCVVVPPITVTDPPPTTTTTKAPTTTAPAPTRPPNWDDDCPFPDPLNYTVHLPHEDDCSKFYKCDNGQKVEFDCPGGLHFNPDLEVCDWPQNAGCVVVPPITVTDPPPTTTTTKAPTTTAPAPTRPPNWDDDCPFPDPLNYTVHLPHEDDCSKFYKCDNGQKVEFDCPGGLHFNPDLEVCDWPQNAGCVVVPPITVTDPPPTTTTTKAPTTTAPAPTRPPNWDDDCPFPDPLNYTVHLPHEDDCSKFYKCDNGQKVEFDCPGGLHFNPDLEVCDWPQNAGCVVVPPITVTDPPPTTTTTKAPTTTAPAPTRPPNWDDDCPFPDPLNHTVHLPHEDDCSKFYVCDNGQKVEFDCPDGLHYNAALEVCDWPQNANCAVVPPVTVTNPPPTDEPSEPEQCPPGYNGTFPHECECGKYYVCKDGEKILYDCPSGEHYNNATGKCDTPENAKCEHDHPPETTTTTTEKPTTTTEADDDDPITTTETPTTTEADDDDPITTTETPTTTEADDDDDDDTPTTTEADDDDDDDTPTTTEADDDDDDDTPTTTEADDDDDDDDTPTTTEADDDDDDDDTPTTTEADDDDDDDDTPTTTEADDDDDDDDTPTTTEADDDDDTTTEEPTTTTTAGTTTTTEAPLCPPNDCQDTTEYYPLLSNARSFIRCVKGQEVVADCPNDLVFDKNLRVCNLEHLVEN